MPLNDDSLQKKEHTHTPIHPHTFALTQKARHNSNVCLMKNKFDCMCTSIIHTQTTLFFLSALFVLTYIATDRFRRQKETILDLMQINFLVRSFSVKRFRIFQRNLLVFFTFTINLYEKTGNFEQFDNS